MCGCGCTLAVFVVSRRRCSIRRPPLAPLPPVATSYSFPNSTTEDSSGEPASAKRDWYITPIRDRTLWLGLRAEAARIMQRFTERVNGSVVRTYDSHVAWGKQTLQGRAAQGAVTVCV